MQPDFKPEPEVKHGYGRFLERDSIILHMSLSRVAVETTTKCYGDPSQLPQFFPAEPKSLFTV